ncbi:MAG: alpha/beta hydrolase [Chloroflexota bacterium]|nr:alpha/beta hydrolase [Chloroflexota bacterium]
MSYQEKSNLTSKMYVQERGSSTAPTLVFLHGGGGAGWMWQPQVEQLEQDYHCLVPDLPEHGQSRAIKPFTIKDSAIRIARIIRQQAHGGKAHIIGISAGAQIGVELLLSAPELIDHAILSSPLLYPLPTTRFYNPMLMAATFRGLVQPFKQNEKYIRFNMKWAAGVPEKYFSQFQENFQQTTVESFTHVMQENLNFGLPAGLKSIQMPTLVVVGRKEYRTMRRSARELARLLPKSQGRMVSLGGRVAWDHNWNLQAPELFNRMVRAWVEDKPLPSELQPLK